MADKISAIIAGHQSNGDCHPMEQWTCKLVSWCQFGNTKERIASKNLSPQRRIGRGQWFFEREVKK